MCHNLNLVTLLAPYLFRSGKIIPFSLLRSTKLKIFCKWENTFILTVAMHHVTLRCHNILRMSNETTACRYKIIFSFFFLLPIVKNRMHCLILRRGIFKLSSNFPEVFRLEFFLFQSNKFQFKYNSVYPTKSFSNRLLFQYRV